MWYQCLSICVLIQCLLLETSGIEVWLTNGDESVKLARQADIAGTGPIGGYNIDVDSNQQFQAMKGYGAALSNSAAYLIFHSVEREQILQDLFSIQNGIGLSYIRLVMGCSDFNAVDPYTYDDSDYEDFNLDQFSIAKDQDFVIPVLRDILRINPAVKIMASPWSAPAWMKNGWTLNGNDLKAGDQYLSTLADFFVRFIQAYQAEGIQIDAITLQNEPEHGTDQYPTMLMPWDKQRDLIAWHVGPRFQQQGITTAIVVWDHNWNDWWYPMNILDDQDARQYVAGSAWHCYAGSRWDPLQVKSAHPDKDLYFTECSGGDWDPDFGSSLSWNSQNIFIGQTRIGARTVLFWNLALDQNHGPTVGVNGCNDCRGVVTVYDAPTPHAKNVEYYALGQFSKFIRQDARRIMSTTYDNNNGDLETDSFLNPDGSIVIVVVNTSADQWKTFQIHLFGQYYYYDNLQPQSVATFIHRL